MIQPLNGNVKINKITDNRLIMVLLIVVFLLLGIIIDDKFVKPKKVEFIYGPKTQVIKTYENTVDSFLRRERISLAKGDILLNSLSDPITDGIKIVLIRVSEEIVCEEERVAFGETVHASKAVPADSLVEVCAGRPGLKKNYFKIIQQNNSQKSREYLGSVMIERPSDRIILAGSDRRVSASDISDASAGSGKDAHTFVDSRDLRLDVSVVSAENKKVSAGIKDASASGGVAGVAITRKSVLKANTLISVEGYGTFVVLNDEGAAGGGDIKLVIPPGFEKFIPGDKKGVRVNLI